VNLVDSSGWLEYLAGSPEADFFAEAIEDDELLVVSVINIYEVFKVVARQRGEGPALQAVAAMRRGTVVDFDFDLALSAAALGATESLALADSVILATARRHNATLWTQDKHFAGKASVQYQAKKA